jgi:predicted O-methyltransferase YrrM
VRASVGSRRAEGSRRYPVTIVSSRLSLLALSVLCALLLLASSRGVVAEDVDDGYRFSINFTAAHAESWQNHLGGLVGVAEARGLEIGCFEGSSTIWFLENVLTHPDSRMACIDVFTPEIEANFDHNVKRSGLGPRLVKHKGYSQDVLRTLPYESFDFVYIDGCHLASCVMTDAVLSWDLLRAGGFMIFDDYLLKANAPPSERPQVGVDAFIEAFGPQLDVREPGAQVILQKRSERSDASLVGKPVVHDAKWLKNWKLMIEASKRRDAEKARNAAAAENGQP